MGPRDNRDLQTVNVFIILILLTVVFGLGVQAVLFAPTIRFEELIPKAIKAFKF